MIGTVLRAYLSGVEVELYVAAYNKDEPNTLRCIDKHGVPYIFRKSPDQKKFNKIRKTDEKKDPAEIDKIIAANYARCKTPLRGR
ncbi:hypothetical protein [Tumebacillus flagellatus]|uniref:Uncharacterized protein n=1 Tax=Tumebacillus flagellatus TaxID=1157490 RepID=A0A074LFF1_9BACL|nr:hypothetical protein [Tumebacillus flagellatus]KEO80971.1 hypothetical protein EL26_23395 [Tumebacillus flagellatus]